MKKRNCVQRYVNLSYIGLTLFALLMIGISGLSLADVIEVPGDYATIQEAIDAATNGDEIIVSPNTYMENINFTGKNLILRSTDPISESIVNATIINGDKKGSVVSFSGTETEECVLSGFTITNGGETTYGGGINGNGALALIQYNNISNNIIKTGEASYGGGIYSCSGIIRYNTINNNIARWGGGIFWCHGRIEHNIISYNSGYDKGGAISYSQAMILDNVISNNDSLTGPLYYCPSLIKGNLIKDNEHSGLVECHGSIRDNIITGNSGPGLAHCQGNILNNIIEKSTYGIWVCNGLIEDNIIRNNSLGGLTSCQGVIKNNTIENNLGGGINYSVGVIQNNTIENNWGGGINGCYDMIVNNIIQGNTASEGGGLYNCLGTIQHNTIRFNQSEEMGGGLCDCDGLITNNLIDYNNGFYAGGGLYDCDGTVANNIITNNIGFTGGGAQECNGIIQNNIIYGNGATAGAGLSLCNGTISNCIIWGNVADIDSQIYLSSSPTYSCIEDWTEGGDGNISSDPLFVDEENGDFHLQTGSPCIDAGEPFTSANDACLPPGMGTPRNDMGAYGGPYNCNWEIPVLKPALADLTQYGDVWAADNIGVPPFQSPSRRGWLGFRFDPENHWYPLKGNADGYGIEDIIQITEYGDAWVAHSSETEYGPPTRWGWLGFRYEETTYNGWLPVAGDVDGTGSDDLIQVTQYGDAWVALSTETQYNQPTRWGWLGFEFSRGEAGNPGAIPLTGDTNGDGLDDLIQITRYGDAWVALSSETMYNPPTRWGWLGFHYSPYDGWYPLCGDVNADGLDDLIQITPTGDPWVALSAETIYQTPLRWGWLNFYYDETQGYYPLLGDVNADGKADLIQITPGGEQWVSLSTGDSFETPERWGWLGFIFSREKGYLPFYLDY